MLRILSARTGSRHAAEEILHEAYARMLELDRPDVAGFLVNYIWKMIWNLLTDEKRREVRRARLDPVALFETERVAPSPEVVLCEQERLELLDKAIDKLPSKEWEAFMLRAQEGLSYKEVGARMGIGERMAQLHVASALKYCCKYMTAAEATRRVPK
jgi:RNA polymerase sigma-70 factor (ECF subfamily)